MKFSKKAEHLVDFVENGHVYVNTAEYFTKCENDEAGQYDKFEMATSYHQHKGASIDLAGRKFKITAPFCTREEPEYSHIFCLYALNDGSISRSKAGKVFDERLWEAFGDYFVFIHDAHSFMERLDSKLNKINLRYKADYVNYFCPNTHEGYVGAFQKRDLFSYQEEYRVAIDKPDTLEPLKDLYLGNLTDVAYGPVCREQSKNSYINGKVIL